jgi:hypothetical protein
MSKARQPAYNVGRYIVQVALYRGRCHARWNQELKRRLLSDPADDLDWDTYVTRRAQAGAGA